MISGTDLRLLSIEQKVKVMFFSEASLKHKYEYLKPLLQKVFGAVILPTRTKELFYWNL